MGTLTVVLAGADLDRAGLDLERRSLPALRGHPIVGGRDLRRLRAADLVDVEEAGRDQRDDSEHGEDQDKEDGAHRARPSQV